MLNLFYYLLTAIHFIIAIRFTIKSKKKKKKKLKKKIKMKEFLFKIFQNSFK